MVTIALGGPLTIASCRWCSVAHGTSMVSSHWAHLFSLGCAIGVGLFHVTSRVSFRTGCISYHWDLSLVLDCSMVPARSLLHWAFLVLGLAACAGCSMVLLGFSSIWAPLLLLGLVTAGWIAPWYQLGFVRTGRIRRGCSPISALALS